ncbi:MAG: hypothetical protein A3F84_03250 [Candidatus Handelsmanbacteria bacterium RIFCSPLOWO2_12_FULL_64_10]|uniref:HDOD domain-containing protein n=1 Tax=Handelsmanbacteria sp. (strain RIFCSPLOWO2_12_FULL_64_10) TaxID=1817868 RepID=A0A1F6CB06_HANXR|nr:MAG: hypothetical protein A3F84_03250 [Candidatus Handelsmanbacteria bacterium RIFCSPLOWO2_12_FULL_64_10]
MPEEKPKCALVVQANRAEAEFLGCFLEKMGGFEVTEALNGPDLVKKLRLGPNLILLDTEMKGDFLRTLEIIRRIPKLESTVIAVVTADQTQLPACQGKGINGYILKPFLPQTLLAKVWKLMASRPEPVKDKGAKTAPKPDLKVDKIDNLPTLPTVYAEVERLCQNPDVDAEDLSRVIEADPSITLKLLRLANSAFFGFTRKISSVKDAISLLGNQTVKNAVLSISIFSATQDQKETAGLDRKRFWQHSAGVGSIARFLARKLRIEREECFTAGILHDVGKVILDGLFSDYYAPVIRASAEQNIPIFQAEQEELGLTHTAVGQELAASWQIPDPLIEGITYHHWPGGADRDPQLASLVHVADVLCRNAGVGSGGDELVPVADDFAFRKLGIDADRILEWEEEMLKEVAKDRTFLLAME